MTHDGGGPRPRPQSPLYEPAGGVTHDGPGPWPRPPMPPYQPAAGSSRGTSQPTSQHVFESCTAWLTQCMLPVMRIRSRNKVNPQPRPRLVAHLTWPLESTGAETHAIPQPTPPLLVPPYQSTGGVNSDGFDSRPPPKMPLSQPSLTEGGGVHGDGGSGAAGIEVGGGSDGGGGGGCNIPSSTPRSEHLPQQPFFLPPHTRPAPPLSPGSEHQVRSSTPARPTRPVPALTPEGEGVATALTDKLASARQRLRLLIDCGRSMLDGNGHSGEGGYVSGAGGGNVAAGGGFGGHGGNGGGRSGGGGSDNVGGGGGGGGVHGGGTGDRGDADIEGEGAGGDSTYEIAAKLGQARRRLRRLTDASQLAPSSARVQPLTRAVADPVAALPNSGIRSRDDTPVHPTSMHPTPVAEPQPEPPGTPELTPVLNLLPSQPTGGSGPWAEPNAPPWQPSDDEAGGGHGDGGEVGGGVFPYPLPPVPPYLPTGSATPDLLSRWTPLHALPQAMPATSDDRRLVRKVRQVHCRLLCTGSFFLLASVVLFALRCWRIGPPLAWLWATSFFLLGVVPMALSIHSANVRVVCELLVLAFLPAGCGMLIAFLCMQSNTFKVPNLLALAFVMYGIALLPTLQPNSNAPSMCTALSTCTALMRADKALSYWWTVSRLFAALLGGIFLWIYHNLTQRRDLNLGRLDDDVIDAM